MLCSNCWQYAPYCVANLSNSAGLPFFGGDGLATSVIADVGGLLFTIVTVGSFVDAQAVSTDTVISITIFFNRIINRTL